MAKKIKKASKPAYLDTTLSFEDRVNDLVSRLTPEEKISQMLHKSPGIPRLAIPGYNWWNECLHGVARAGIATVFPQAIGLAATFNDTLVYGAASAISDEARVKYHRAIKNGRHEMYYGLTFWSPNINIFRDPRWGRGHETYGEDPYLTSMIGKAFVKGLQGDDRKYLKVSACAKHFAVHSGPEALRHTFDAKVSEKDLRETYLPAFKALVTEAGVESVMGAYNRTLGEPCCASKKLMVDILRGEWGFKGHYVSDCGAIHDIYQNHKYTKTAAEAAALSVKMGCDLNCCLGQDMCSESAKGLDKAYRFALLDRDSVDRSVKRLFMTRFRLGMFDPPAKVKYSKIPFSALDSKKNRSLALETARQSLVLLKNEGSFLPLNKKKIRSIAVVGPNADDIDALLGNYGGFPSAWTTPLQGIKKLAGKGVKINYIKGCQVKEMYSDHISGIVEMADESDAVIAVMGLNGKLEGEEGAGDGDREDLKLPPAQNMVLEALCRTGKPVVVVMMTGSCVTFDAANKNIKAVLQAWYPGEEGGTAIAEALFGAYNPAGRLPVTFYKGLLDLPDFRDYSMENRTYRYFKGKPLYPFGFGLSYTRFEYSKLKAAKSIKFRDSLRVSVEVKNSGKYNGDEVVQLYIKYPAEIPDAPRKTLCGIKRVFIKKGAKKIVRFVLTPEQMSVYNKAGEPVLEPGEYTLYAGGIQPGFEKTAPSTGLLGAKFLVSGWSHLEKKNITSGYEGFKVKGRFIYDANGEKFIIRGINKMVVWLDPKGEQSFNEIEKTGANAVRIVWSIKDGTMEGLDLAIQNCVKKKMVPIIELHDHTGGWNTDVFRELTGYWTDPRMVSIIKKHERYLLLNYGNELGNDKVTNKQYRDSYLGALKKIRAAGIRVPVMIDAAAWGMGMQYVLDNAGYLVKNDPGKNLIFSIHMWWNDGNAQRVRDALRAAAKREIPLVVAEFSVAGPENKGMICYETIIYECQRTQTGWMAWEWGPGNEHGNLMNMTKDGKFGTLWGWAKEVCLGSPYSIKATSVRPDIF